jgi:hypothetical protein
MKKLLLVLLIAVFSLRGYSQANGALGGFYLTDAGGTQVSSNALVSGSSYILKLPISNTAFAQIPSGGIGITISLGGNMAFVGSGVIANSASSYFTSSISGTSPNQQMTLTQAAPIPGLTYDELAFNVIVVGNTPPSGSTIIGNLGSNPPYNDANPSDNTSTLTYFTTIILPTKFAKVDAQNVNCSLSVNWSVADETNVQKYDVLVSGSGSPLATVASVNGNPANGGLYSTNVEIPANLKGQQVLFVQVREVDADGHITLSSIQTVRGTCDGTNRPLVVYVYPNPVTSTNFVNIGAKEGVFNGKYKLELIDNSGKLYQVKEAQLSNVTSVPFEFKTALAPGNYIIRISNMDGSQTSSVQFIKIGIL